MNHIIHFVESHHNFAEQTIIHPLNCLRGARTIFIGHIDKYHYVSTIQASGQLNSSRNCHSLFNDTQTVGNTVYICIPVEKSNKTGNVPSKKSKTCAIDKEENCTTYMRQYMRKRRANESNDDRAKRLKVQRDACKETKAMLGHAISLFHSLVSKGLIYT